jgi:hypothetical protein
MPFDIVSFRTCEYCGWGLCVNADPSMEDTGKYPTKHDDSLSQRKG